MDPDLNEWLKLILRWIHVFASILWVGSTFFFTWLDGRFVALENQTKDPTKPDSSPEKHVWMVHSGGFYKVEKQRVPHLMPEKLHWFRWEAAFTWLSGLLLFFLVYYHGGLMVESEDARINQTQAIWLSVALLLVAWPFYNFLWFKLVKNEAVNVILSFALLAALAWFLCHFFSGRAAYLQVGGMLGTIMTANVWM